MLKETPQYKGISKTTRNQKGKKERQRSFKDISIGFLKDGLSHSTENYP